MRVQEILKHMSSYKEREELDKLVKTLTEEDFRKLDRFADSLKELTRWGLNEFKAYHSREDNG